MAQILGLHHVTAVAGDPQRNLDFFSGVLGMRLVKLTVAFDHPSNYHLYYGDGKGTPGSILTFFPWPSVMKGRHGNGQTAAISFALPLDALVYWTDRLKEHSIRITLTEERFGESVIEFFDPDGLRIELVATKNVDEDRIWELGPVPAEYAIRGFHSVTLAVEGYDPTSTLLTDHLGFAKVGREGDRFRFSIGDGRSRVVTDIVCAPHLPRGRAGIGCVHHVAWRTPNDTQQKEWLDKIRKLHYDVSPVRDRKYFHSIYFREPGGVLFEIATDQPGFGVDEPEEALGTHLVLPPWLESQRAQLENALPSLKLPQVKW
ncbi:MAG: ring-cleaving dioxygenase [Verrucomicrobia bacterium]|nr:ring-cleaving dioxygenase [Verrucomicrobiota bacterium]